MRRFSGLYTDLSRSSATRRRQQTLVGLFLLGLPPARIHSKLVRRAPDPPALLIEDMGIYHRRAHVLVPQEFLYRPDVIAILK